MPDGISSVEEKPKPESIDLFTAQGEEPTPTMSQVGTANHCPDYYDET